MIPEFNKFGYLPPGIHFCEWEEFLERFGTNSRRNKMINGLELAMEQLKMAGCRTIYIDGSFITIKVTPGDFDACWDDEDVDMSYLQKNAKLLLTKYDRQSQKARYKGELYRSNEPVGDLGLNSLEFFQRDRMENKKGIIAIDLVRWEP